MLRYRGRNPIISHGRFLSLVATLTLILACASGQVRNYYFEDRGGEGGSSEIIVNDVRVVARYLDDESLGTVLREQGYERMYLQMKDLPLNSFLLKVSNGTSSSLFFDPNQARLMDGETVNLSPIDFAELYTLLPKGEGRQAVLKDLQRASFNRLVKIEPGASLEKLLVFDRPEVMGKDVSLVLNDVYVDGEALPVTMMFEARSYEDGT